jgi:hypothetical protein
MTVRLTRSCPPESGFVQPRGGHGGGQKTPELAAIPAPQRQPEAGTTTRRSPHLDMTPAARTRPAGVRLPESVGRLPPSPGPAAFVTSVDAREIGMASREITVTLWVQAGGAALTSVWKLRQRRLSVAPVPGWEDSPVFELPNDASAPPGVSARSRPTGSWTCSSSRGFDAWSAFCAAYLGASRDRRGSGLARSQTRPRSRSRAA